MDTDIARWLLEFLLRQPWLEDRLINSLIRALPFEGTNSSLKSSFLLRKIESEASNGILSEKILEYLEQIEELEYKEGTETLESMKKAYCAVAVECTVRFLKGSEIDKGDKYFDAVKRMWRGRVSEMEKFEMGVGLISEGLKEWRDKIEAGVWDLSACEDVLASSRGMNALEAVRSYIYEARKRMGPSFLEVLAETVMSDNTVRDALGWGIDEICDQGREGVSCVPNDGNDVVTGKGDEESHKEHMYHSRKHIIAVGRCRIPAAITSRGAKIVDTEELIHDSHGRYRCVPTPETKKVQETLKSSCLELKAVVHDPLPDALHLAETLRSDMPREYIAPSSSAIRSADTPQAKEGNLGNNPMEKNDVPKPSLIARNSTAHVIEWDSVSDSAEETAKRPNLPSPKQRVISPLKKYEIANLPRRRRPKRWSTLEEDTLRTGVQKYGTGQWKLILSIYRDIFEERTECDLKDKWRNLIRC